MHITRTIEIDMSDKMRFSPDMIKVKKGDVIKFVHTNSGQQMHEFVLGTSESLTEHAEMMKKVVCIQTLNGNPCQNLKKRPVIPPKFTNHALPLSPFCFPQEEPIEVPTLQTSIRPRDTSFHYSHNMAWDDRNEQCFEIYRTFLTKLLLDQLQIA